MHSALIVLQAASAMIGPPAPVAARASSSALPCPKGAEGEVVVCGAAKRDDPHRLKPLPDRVAEDPQLRFRLPGGGTIAPNAAASGWGSTRVMATLRLPF